MCAAHRAQEPDTICGLTELMNPLLSEASRALFSAGGMRRSTGPSGFGRWREAVMPALCRRRQGTATGASHQHVDVLPEKAGSPERGRLALAVDPLVACGLVVFLGCVRLVAAGNGAGREVAGAEIGRAHD